jgi:hypothetical protein
VISTPKRYRDKAHLAFVARRPCLICGRKPCDPHHLRFAQPRALGRKVSDEFTVPLCRTHHRALHRSGNERAWWASVAIEPMAIAGTLWAASRRSAARRRKSTPPMGDVVAPSPTRLPSPADQTGGAEALQLGHESGPGRRGNGVGPTSSA